MKLVNPNYVDPRTAKVNAHKAAVQSYLAAHPEQEFVTLAELRGAIGGQFAVDIDNEGLLAEIGRALGLECCL